VVEAGLLEAKAGTVRLLRVAELDADWEPETDATPTVWEMTHHLCRRYDSGGERAAADLVRRLGHHAEAAQQLAFRLFLVCDTRKWSEDAQPYNRLGTAWNDLVRLALDPTAAPRSRGQEERADTSEEETLYADD
jgi:putative DNA methylase